MNIELTHPSDKTSIFYIEVLKGRIDEGNSRAKNWHFEKISIT